MAVHPTVSTVIYIGVLHPDAIVTHLFDSWSEFKGTMSINILFYYLYRRS
ncbi:hypothetical protein LguiB_012401 [Lonicera macranthoides]